MKRFPFCLTMVTLFVVIDSARAELRVIDSVEWMTDDAQLILRGRVKSIAQVPQGSGFQDITIEILETLKGKAGGKEIVIRSWSGAAKEGGECLFFLKRGDSVYPAGDYRRPIVGDRWTQRVFWNGNPYGVIDLAKPSEETVSAKMKLLTRREQILKVVVDRIKHDQKHPPIIKPVEMDAKTKARMPALGVIRRDANSEVYDKLWAGSAVWVFVPADAELRPTIVSELKERRRADLVAALANYPGKETEQLLRGMLDDASEARTTDQKGRVLRIAYPIREAAYAALLRLGVRVPQPVLEKSPR